jgi:hypothetical protein
MAVRHLPHRHRRARAGVRGRRLAVLRDRSTAHQAAPGWLITPGLAHGPGAHSRHSQKPGCGYAADPAFNCLIIASKHCWRWSCRMLTAANVPPRPQARPPPCDPTLPVWQAPSGWCRLTSFGSCGRLAGHLERRHGPFHPMGVTTAHLGYAHAGRHRAGWAKGRTGMANPSGSRTPPRPAATATCWSTTSKRSPPAWRARCHKRLLPPRRRSPAPPAGFRPFRSLR